MTDSRSSRAWPRAFLHPLWWAALGLLLLNDHVWKGSDLLPAPITGKLSDFAGMLVAPPLLALCLRALGARARALAAAVVGVGFASIKLFAGAAHLLERGLLVIGLPGHVCLDRSDLWALLALPIGAWLCRPAEMRARRAELDWTRRAGLALSALACLATVGSGGSSNDSSQGDAPAVKNATSSTLTLVVASTDGAGGCSIYRDDRIAALTSNAFGAAREITLKPGAVALLPGANATATCGAASIGLPDGEVVLVFWRDLGAVASFVPADDPRRLARLVSINGKSGHFDPNLGDDLSHFELGGTPPNPTCKQPAVNLSLEATVLAATQGFLKLGEMRTAQDSCLEVDWFMSEGDTSPDTQRLCIPDWAFPFQTGDRLSVTQELAPFGERMLRITRFSGSAIDTQLTIWNDAAKFPDSQIQSLKSSDCVGSLSSCGAYLRSAEVSVRGKDRTLVAGAETTLQGKQPKQIRIVVGATRDVAWTSPTCAGAEARLGPTASLLELRTY